MAIFIDAQDRVDPEFAALMTRLAAPYQTAKLSTDGIKVYARVLQRAGLNLDQVRQMFGKALTECKYFPSVAELMHFVVPDADDAAVLAWARLEHLAEAKGAYEDVTSEDVDAPTLAALVMIFGSWPSFCDMEDGPLLTRKRQEFLAAYRQARLRGTNGATTAPGLCSMTNQQYPQLSEAVARALITTGEK